jgi:hypothetical protein
MALRIACDLDGTVADMEKALQEEAERLFGPDVDLRARGHVVAERDDEGGHLRAAPEDREATGPGSSETSRAPETAEPPEGKSPEAPRKALTDSQLRRLWAHVRGIENFWTTLGEIEPGIVADLARVATDYRWEVLFVTQRPATNGDTAQRQSQQWLAKHGFEYPSVYVMNGSRGKLADALGLHVVVDDRTENCLDVKTDSRAWPLLVWRESPEVVPPALRGLGIEVVFSMTEALKALEEMTRTMNRPRGLLARIRHAMGAS